MSSKSRSLVRPLVSPLRLFVICVAAITATAGCGDDTKPLATPSDGAVDGQVTGAAGQHGDGAVAGNAGSAGLDDGGPAGGSAAGASGDDGGVAPGDAAATLTAVELTPPVATIAAGTKVSFAATARYSDGSTHDVTATATWSTSPPGIATITGSTALGVATGDATVSAAFGGVAGTAALRVTAATLQSIAVEPIDAQLPLGVTLALKATGLFSDGSKQDLTTQAAWTVDDASVLTLAGAVATGAKQGATHVNATLLGVTGSANVTVTPATLASLEIAPAQATLAAGVSRAFVATGVYSDDTKLDVGAQATWSSGDPTVLVVSDAAGSKGSATGVKAGTATVTVSFGGKQAQASVIVTPAALVTIAVTPATATAAAGTTATFTAVGTYSDGATVDVTGTATWSAGDPTVAAVSNADGSRGVATGLVPGQTTIVATLGAVSGQAALTVAAAKLTTLVVAPAASSLPAGRKLQLTATGTYTDGKVIDVTNRATWTTSAPSIAGVTTAGTGAGQVSAIKPGAARITAALDGVMAGADVTVTDAALDAITVSPATASAVAGTLQAFTAQASYSDGSTLDVTKQVVWSSDAPTVATIANASGAQGIATGLATGMATIHARLSGKDGTATFTVTAPTLVRIAVSPVTASRHVGEQQGFSASAILSNGTSRNTGMGTTWATSNAAVATVGNNGNARCAAVGTATITATYMGQSDSATLTCTDAIVVRIQVLPVTASLFVGANQPFQAVAIYTDDSTRSVTNMATWTTSDGTVASVRNTGGMRGLVSGVGAGQATVSAAYMGFSDSATVTVTAAKLNGIMVTPVLLSLHVGQTQQLVVTGTYTDGSTQTVTGQASYDSTDPAVADVTNGGGGGGPGGGGGGGRGLVTALTGGTTKITASYMGFTDSTTVTVSAAKVVSLQVAPALASLVVGQLQAFQATAVYDDATIQQVTNAAVWSSSAPTVADVSNGAARGTATALATGQTTISAVWMGQTGSASVTVKDATLVEIQVTPTNPTVPVGLSRGFVATGLYSDLSTRDLTALATWSSSSDPVAQVSNAPGSKGTATALTAGTATITASYGGKAGATTLTSVAVDTLASIDVDPPTPTIAVGAPQPFRAIGHFGGGTIDLTVYATWISTDKTVAVVSNADGSRGLATGLAAGSTSIQANFQGKQGAATLTVTGP